MKPWDQKEIQHDQKHLWEYTSVHDMALKLPWHF